MFDPTPGDVFVQAGSFNAEIISGLCVRVTSYIKQLISSRAMRPGLGIQEMFRCALLNYKHVAFES